MLEPRTVGAPPNCFGFKLSMGYSSLQKCVWDLENSGRLVRIEQPIDPRLEAAALQRRVYAAGGPALLLANPVGSPFPMACNLFGTVERARYMLRDGLAAVERLVTLKTNPQAALRRPWRHWSVPLVAGYMLPKVVRSGPILDGSTSVGQLPQLVSWPRDGGPFVTLPIVYTEDVDRPGWRHSNLGMYRVQLGGNAYVADREIGLHYQIHRGIGVHHAAAMRRGEPLRVNIFVGGPPALSLAAVMPLPEGLSEITFAGALGRRRVRMIRRANRLPLLADCDFCISGVVEPDRLLPEGPFGDHLGYYSLAHPFPVMRVEQVHHRRDAIWPFTVVGRPPQEDTVFGQLIHEITGPLIPTVLAGVSGVHAVDAAGVHPLLLAIGSERYTPFEGATQPRELLTQANAILGQGQLSLAKFLLIAARHDDLKLRLDDEPAFFRHVLQRADWTRDLHFQTQTTIDTLDYSGAGFNAGSKLVIAAAGPPRFRLVEQVKDPCTLPPGFAKARVVLPGIAAVEGPRCPSPTFAYEGSPDEQQRARLQVRADAERFTESIARDHPLNAFRWIVLVDDSQFVTESMRNFLWVVFTRTDPARDVYGIDAFTNDKHWGCRGALVIDARIKPHHAPVLEEDLQTERRIDALAAPGGPLHGVF